MKKFNLSKKVSYMKGAEEKTYWEKVGTMTEFDNGNMIVEIPAIGLTASVFPDDRQAKTVKAVEPTVQVDDIEYPEEDINPDDIPF